MIFFRKKKKVEKKTAPLKVVQKAKPVAAAVEEKILTAEGWRRRKALSSRPKSKR
jgi:hypothetical protein